MEMAVAAGALLGSAEIGSEFCDAGSGVRPFAAGAGADPAGAHFLGPRERNRITELDQTPASRWRNRRVSPDGLGVLLVALGDAPHSAFLAVS